MLFRADIPTDGQTDITKLIVAYRRFAKAPTRNIEISHKISFRLIRTPYKNDIDNDDVTDYSDTDCDVDDNGGYDN
jgi:hypothetical protein